MVLVIRGPVQSKFAFLFRVVLLFLSFDPPCQACGYYSLILMKFNAVLYYCYKKSAPLKIGTLSGPL